MRVRSRAPSTIANLGCLFDLGALAVDLFWDEAEVELEPGGTGVEVEVTGPHASDVPLGEGNVAYVAVSAFLRECLRRERAAVRIRLTKGVPVARGLGSSGATVAAVLGALSKAISCDFRSLAKVAGEAEGFVSGSVHYDNVYASMFGGLVLLGGVGEGPPLPLRLSWPDDLVLVIAVHRGRTRERKTRTMRSVLPASIALGEAVAYQSLQVLFLKGLLEGDRKALGKAVSYGGVVERVRSAFIRGYWQVKERALRSGALGFNIAGAGPSVFAVAEESFADPVAEAIRIAFEEVGEPYDVVIARASPKGSLDDAP